MTLSKWQMQEAKAKFSQLIKSLSKGDQFITYRGELIAVVISKERYEELITPAETLIDFFKKAPLQHIDIKIERSRDLPRDISL
jgi:prevent-host-death family protein